MTGQYNDSEALTDDELVALTFGHLTAEGLDDIFKPPLLNEPIEEVHLGNPKFSSPLQSLTKQFLVNLKAKGFSAPLHLNIPKTRHTYRRASLLDIKDLTRYTALVFGLGDYIERARIQKEKNVVFSSRFVRSTPCFDKSYGHSEFRRQSDIITKSGNFSVKIYTDIANFFDRLNLHRLEGVLVDIGCPREKVRLLNNILLHWADRNSYGIPVGCDASRLLAEAMLINVDKKLLDSGAKFVRYVDDYRIFAQNYAEAHGFLALLTSALEEEGLFINGSKTRIASVANDASEHESQDPNRSKNSFEKIDENETVEIRRVVGNGYNSRIAKYYHTPGKDAIKRLKDNNQEELLKLCLLDDPEEENLKEFVKTIIYSEIRNPLDLLIVCDRHIHLIAYVADSLTKESVRFTAQERRILSEELAKRYDGLSRSEYYRLCIARVLSHSEYRQEATFRGWLQDLPITTNPAFLKELIGFFGPSLSRESIRELVKIAENYHPSVTRVIVSYALSSDNCLYAERRAWAKRWMQSCDDLLVRALCAPFLNSISDGDENSNKSKPTD